MVLSINNSVVAFFNAIACQQKGYDELLSIVPTCHQQESISSQKMSKATVLQRCESCVCVCVCVCVCTHGCMCVHCVCGCIYIYMCVCGCVCAHVFVCVYMYMLYLFASVSVCESDSASKGGLISIGLVLIPWPDHCTFLFCVVCGFVLELLLLLSAF